MTEQDFSDIPQTERHGALLAYIEHMLQDAVAEALRHIEPDHVREIVEREIRND
jgi:hypothetical protein